MYQLWHCARFGESIRDERIVLMFVAMPDKPSGSSKISVAASLSLCPRSDLCGFLAVQLDLVPTLSLLLALIAVQVRRQ